MEIQIVFLILGAYILAFIGSYIELDAIKGFLVTLALILAFNAGGEMNKTETRIVYRSELSDPTVKLEIVDGDTVSMDTTYVYKPNLNNKKWVK